MRLRFSRLECSDVGLHLREFLVSFVTQFGVISCFIMISVVLMTYGCAQRRFSLLIAVVDTH